MASREKNPGRKQTANSVRAFTFAVSISSVDYKSGSKHWLWMLMSRWREISFAMLENSVLRAVNTSSVSRAPVSQGQDYNTLLINTSVKKQKFASLLLYVGEVGRKIRCNPILQGLLWSGSSNTDLEPKIASQQIFVGNSNQVYMIFQLDTTMPSQPLNWTASPLNFHCGVHQDLFYHLSGL